jgi:hypothetical protein
LSPDGSICGRPRDAFGDVPPYLEATRPDAGPHRRDPRSPRVAEGGERSPENACFDSTPTRVDRYGVPGEEVSYEDRDAIGDSDGARVPAFEDDGIGLVAPVRGTALASGKHTSAVHLIHQVKTRGIETDLLPEQPEVLGDVLGALRRRHSEIERSKGAPAHPSTSRRESVRETGAGEERAS